MDKRRRAEAGTGPESLLLGSARVLWPGGEVRVVRGHHPPAGTSDWLVLPSLSAPRWLVPAAARSTAGALAGQEASISRRLAAGALAVGHRHGLLGRLPLRRLRVMDDGSLVAVVREALGRPAHVAVRLGSWQHARTVVLRAFDPDGTTLAFAKLGIDRAGRDAVRAETDALERVAGFGLRRIEHSAVLHRAAWGDCELVVVSPLLAAGDRRDEDRPTDAMRELAASGAARSAPLETSGWWARTTRRLAAVDDRTRRAELAGHLASISRAAGTTLLSLGPCHGDWTAWNMARDGERVLLWDWEHFGEDVPVGFDAAHFLAQQLRVSVGTGPAAEATWRARVEAALDHDLGVPPAGRGVVVAAYLLDVNLRFLLDRQGTPLAAAARQGWGLPLLGRAVRDLVAGPSEPPQYR